MSNWALVLQHSHQYMNACPILRSDTYAVSHCLWLKIARTFPLQMPFLLFVLNLLSMRFPVSGIYAFYEFAFLLLVFTKITALLLVLLLYTCCAPVWLLSLILPQHWDSIVRVNIIMDSINTCCGKAIRCNENQGHGRKCVILQGGSPQNARVLVYFDLVCGAWNAHQLWCDESPCL